jgi:tetratricopeptide (TPR) repeat protein
MTEAQKHCCISITFLAVLCLASAVCLAQSALGSGSPSVANLRSSRNTRETSSRAKSSGEVVQAPIDLFAYIQASDALITLDVKRLINEALPHLIAGEQDMRELVIAINDLKTVRGLDPRAMQRLVMGLRYTNPAAGTSQRNFDTVGVAQSSEAGQLPTLVHSMGPGKFREQHYGGKLLYIVQLDQTEPTRASREVTTTDKTEWAVVALDANTLIFGDSAYVRSSIDLNSGKGTNVSPELVAAVKRSPKALLSAAGLLPDSLMTAAQPLVSGEMSRTLSSLKSFYASVEPTPTGFDVLFSLYTTSPEQAKTLAEVLTAFKTLSGSLAASKTAPDRLARDLVKGLVISAINTEVQVRDEIAQSTVDALVKQIASAMYIGQGLAQMDQGDPEGAIANYEKAIILDPESVVAFINRGQAQARKGTLDAAIADYDKAISLDPNSAVAYNNRGFARVKKGDFDAAIVDLERAIALNPTDAFAYNNRGMALAGKGNLDDAMADYDKSIALDAGNALAYQNRGNTRNQTGDWNGAIADFERLITLSPKSAESYNGRGLARYYQGELDQAVADYDKAIALDPKSANAYNNRGLALADKGDLDKAMADYNKAIALDAQNDIFYRNRGDLRNEKGEWEGAIADFDKAISINPKVAALYNGRGLARYCRQESDKAIADFDRAIAIDPNAVIYVNRGHARNQKGDWGGAIADFDKAIAINPKSADAYNGRGVTRFDKGDLDAAIADYDKAIVINPNFAEAYGNRALCRLAQHKDSEAEQDLKKCFELDESLRSVFEALAKDVKKTRRAKPRNHH